MFEDEYCPNCENYIKQLEVENAALRVQNANLQENLNDLEKALAGTDLILNPIDQTEKLAAQQARIDRLLQELEATRAIGDEKQARIEALRAGIEKLKIDYETVKAFEILPAKENFEKTVLETIALLEASDG